jgi:hypothetical protein
VTILMEQRARHVTSSLASHGYVGELMAGGRSRTSIDPGPRPCWDETEREETQLKTIVPGPRPRPRPLASHVECHALSAHSLPGAAGLGLAKP